jgi:hypothetical protein
MSAKTTKPDSAALATQANDLIGSLAERFAEDHEHLEDVDIIPDFHYQQGLELDVIAHALNIETAKMGRAVRISLDHAIVCGKLLLVAKLSLKHGAWARWLEANTTISCRSASGYMRLASNRKRIADLDCGVADALELLADQSAKKLEPARPEVAPAPAPAPAPARRSPPPLIIDAEIVNPATVPQDGPEPAPLVIDGTKPDEPAKPKPTEPKTPAENPDLAKIMAILPRLSKDELSKLKRAIALQWETLANSQQ